MRSQHFRGSESDHCLYTKKATNGNIVILILYVDDMLLASRKSYELDGIWAKLHEAFDMKDLLKFNQIFSLIFITWRTNANVIFGMFGHVHKLVCLFLISFGLL